MQNDVGFLFVRNRSHPASLAEIGNTATIDCAAYSRASILRRSWKAREVQFDCDSELFILESYISQAATFRLESIWTIC